MTEYAGWYPDEDDDHLTRAKAFGQANWKENEQIELLYAIVERLDALIGTRV